MNCRGIPNLFRNASFAGVLLVSGVLLLLGGVAAAQACGQNGGAGASVADGTRGPDNGSPALTGARHPLYRLQKSDTVQISFTFSPEFDQTVTVLPDGFIDLKSVGEVPAEGLTIVELQYAVRAAYAPILRDPEVSVALSDFERPFFVAGGQLGRPGKYELRAPTTVTEAVAIAGGFTDQSKHSQVVLFRKVANGIVESHVLNVKTMLNSRNLEEDLELRPGDMLFVPQNRISKIRKFLPVASLSTFFTPAQF